MINICVEGIMGVGKSSLVKAFSGVNGYRVFSERVCFDSGVDNGFYTQMKFLVSRYRQWSSNAPDFINLYDRSIWSDIVFASIAHMNGDMTEDEFELYVETRNTFLEECKKPDLIMFLSLPVISAQERLVERGEIDKETSIKFLKQQEIAYNIWLEDMKKLGIPVHFVDATQSKDDVFLGALVKFSQTYPKA